MQDLWSSLQSTTTADKPKSTLDKLRYLSISPTKSLEEDPDIFTYSKASLAKTTVDLPTASNTHLSAYLPTVTPILEKILDGDVDHIIQQQQQAPPAPMISPSVETRLPRRIFRPQTLTELEYQLPGTFIPTVRIDLTLKQEYEHAHKSMEQLDVDVKPPLSTHRQNYGGERPGSPVQKFESASDINWADLRKDLKCWSEKLHGEKREDSSFESWVAISRDHAGMFMECLKTLEDAFVGDLCVVDESVVFRVSYVSLKQFESAVKSAGLEHSLVDNVDKGSISVDMIPVVIACEAQVDIINTLFQSVGSSVIDMTISCVDTNTKNVLALENTASEYCLVLVPFTEMLASKLDELQLQANSVFACKSPEDSKSLTQQYFPHVSISHPTQNLTFRKHLVVTLNQRATFIQSVFQRLHERQQVVTNWKTVRASDILEHEAQLSNAPFVTVFWVHGLVSLDDMASNELLLLGGDSIRSLCYPIPDFRVEFGDQSMVISSPVRKDFFIPRTTLSKKNSVVLVVSTKSEDALLRLSQLFQIFHDVSARLLLGTTIWLSLSEKTMRDYLSTFKDFFSTNNDGPVLVLVVEESGRKSSAPSRTAERIASLATSSDIISATGREASSVTNHDFKLTRS